MKEIIIDIGNTDLVLGLWEQGRPDPVVSRINSKIILKNPSELDSLFKFLNAAEFSSDAAVITISSVVPAVMIILSEFLNAHSIEYKLLDKAVFDLLPIKVLAPNEIGSDLVANALAAHHKYHKLSTVIDFGTALSMVTISEKGEILGVSIAPGLITAMTSLTGNTALLNNVPLHLPPSPLGSNTVEAIQSGILIGYDGLIRGLISAQERYIQNKIYRIATGGLAKIITSLDDFIDTYDPFLTLEGIKLAGEFIKGLKTKQGTTLDN